MGSRLSPRQNSRQNSKNKKLVKRSQLQQHENSSYKGTSLADEIGDTYSNKHQKYSIYDSFKIYLSSWFSNGSCHNYESELLNNVPLMNNPNSARKVEILNTLTNEKDAQSYIHEVCITNTEPSDNDDEPIDIVLVHGYAAALGFFYKNIEGLSAIPNSKLHLIDLLGFGCSGRPYPYPISGDKTKIKDVLECESFFIDSFESWRIKRGIKKCVVVAHSLGGYLMSCYYLKYGRSVIDKLILISPVGVEDNDMSLYKKYEMTEHDENGSGYDVDGEEVEISGIDREYNIAMHQGIDISKELTDHLHDDEEEEEEETELDSDNESIISIISHDGTDTTHQTQIEKLMKQIKTRVIPGKFLTKLWELNFTPIDIVRLFGPLSGKVVSIWVYNRFNKVESNELIDICNYTTRIFIERGSGEYCLGSILAPGSLARLPIVKRLPSQIEIPILLLYGELDWMDKSAGLELCSLINGNGGDAKFRIVPNAGHHLYVDNSEEFERQVISFIRR